MTTEHKQKSIHIQIMIDEVIDKLRHFVRSYDIESLFVVGNYCRDIYIGNVWDLDKIEVVSAYAEQSTQLGSLFATEVLHCIPKFNQQNSTAKINYTTEFGDINIEFQGFSNHAYMHNQEIKTWFQEQHIEHIPIVNNVYGREFTINSLIYSLNSGGMYDPTDRAILDFDKKVISSLLPAKVLIKYSPLSSLHAIRLALKYGFHIDDELRHEMKSVVPILLKSISSSRILNEIIHILEINSVEGLELLKKHEMDSILLSPSIRKHLNLEKNRE